MAEDYRFIDKDPIIDVVRTVFEDTGSTYEQVERDSGVTAQTVRSWLNGKTRRPQHLTVRFVLKAMGVELRPVYTTSGLPVVLGARQGNVLKMKVNK